MNTPLKKYKCHKEVHAAPMSRGVYNLMRGWTIPVDENPLDEGMVVYYNKDTNREHVSWSPQDVFEEGYTDTSIAPFGVGSDCTDDTVQ